MSIPHHTTVAPPVDQSDEARFAHELANLLDGSMRNVTLIATLVRDSGGAAEPVLPVDDALLRRLNAVEDGMRQMTTLLRRWIEGHREADALHGQVRPLAEVIDHAVSLFKPAADALRIELTLRIDADAARLPAGPLYPIIANGLRNAVEAISQGRAGGRPCGRIEILASRCEGRLILTITDDGPGLDPELLDADGNFLIGNTTKLSGHGLGLALCRDIAQSLDGRLTLRNARPQGAVLALQYPVMPQRLRAAS